MTWTREDHDRALELCAAATPGPWEGRVGVGPCDYIVKAETGHDAAFIAAARELLPRAVERITELERANQILLRNNYSLVEARDALRAEVERLNETVGGNGAVAELERERYLLRNKLARAIEALRMIALGEHPDEAQDEARATLDILGVEL